MQCVFAVFAMPGATFFFYAKFVAQEQRYLQEFTNHMEFACKRGKGIHAAVTDHLPLENEPDGAGEHNKFTIKVRVVMIQFIIQGVAMMAHAMTWPKNQMDGPH